MSVAVIVDGAVGLDRGVAADWGITVLPLSVAVDGHAVEAADVDAAGPGRATTSGPSPGAFAAAFEGAADGAVVVTVAATLSGTHQAAVIASRLAEVPVRVVDSTTAAGGQALVARAAALAAVAGGSVDDVERAARRATGEVRLVGALASLDGLVRSGRVPGLAGFAGRMLNVNPLFELRDGKVRPLRPAFTRDAARQRMVDVVGQSRPDGSARLQVIALHAQAADAAHDLLAAVSGGAEPDLAVVTEFGPELVAVTGPGVVGVAWRWLSG